MYGVKNNRSKGRIKISAAVGLVFLLILSNLLLFQGAAYCSQSAPDITMQVSGGYDGVARLGAYIPYNILLINKGRAVVGEVQIEIKMDSERKTIFAKPCNLPEGSTKEIVITAPVFTARRAVTVRVQENGRTLKEMEYKFFKMIPPDMKTVGILSSDNAAYGFLNGIELPVRGSAVYEEHQKLIMASGGYSTSSVVREAVDVNAVKKESVLIRLEKETMPDDLKVMNGFDVLIISNFDTGTLSAAQSEVLEKWVENGGTLVVGTGVNWKKTYDALPETLKRFSVTGIESVAPPSELAEFAEKEFTSDVKMELILGDIGFEGAEKTKTDRTGNDGNKENAGGDENSGNNNEINGKRQAEYSSYKDEVIAGSVERPLAVKYVNKQGRVLLLMFDPGMEPFTAWDGKQQFWEGLLFHVSANVKYYSQTGDGYYYQSINKSHQFDYLTRQVPEDKKPPFLFMFITIAVYTVIIGPVMYILLKRKDRRDLNWLVVPAVSLLCLFVIYMVGFRTRYKTAVLNAISLITLDMENRKADIETGMSIFNNKKGDLELTYSKDSKIEYDIYNSNSQRYVSYTSGNEPESRVVSKLLFTEPLSYELYDVGLWEPKYLSAHRSESFENKLIVSSVQIKDGNFSAVIKNQTGYDLMDTFISIGSNIFGIGDILPEQEAVVEVNLNSEDVYGSVGAYLDAKYGRSASYSGISPPGDYSEKQRKKTMVQNIMMDNFYSTRGQMKIGLYALNTQSMSHDLKVNGKTPQSFHLNGIFTAIGMSFDKGKELEIPYGMVIPSIEFADRSDSRTAYMEDFDSIRIMQEGDIDFIYTLPAGILYKGFSLRFETDVPLYVKYNMEERKQKEENFQGKILRNSYEYYIYNNSAKSWGKIGEEYNNNRDTTNYIDGENRLKVRVKVVEMADDVSGQDYEYIEAERLKLPKLQLKGVGE